MIFKLLFSYTLDYWKKQSQKEKFFIILVVLAMGFGMYHYTGKAWYKYKYFKALEKEVVTLKDSISLINKKEAKIITKAKTTTKKAKTKAKAIDTKLKEDEKTIDNSDVSDDELRDFLAKYN